MFRLGGVEIDSHEDSFAQFFNTLEFGHPGVLALLVNGAYVNKGVWEVDVRHQEPLADVIAWQVGGVEVEGLVVCMRVCVVTLMATVDGGIIEYGSIIEDGLDGSATAAVFNWLRVVVVSYLVVGASDS